jgi:hypothetical protein
MSFAWALLLFGTSLRKVAANGDCSSYTNGRSDSGSLELYDCHYHNRPLNQARFLTASEYVKIAYCSFSNITGLTTSNGQILYVSGRDLVLYLVSSAVEDINTATSSLIEVDDHDGSSYAYLRDVTFARVTSGSIIRLTCRQAKLEGITARDSNIPIHGSGGGYLVYISAPMATFSRIETRDVACQGLCWADASDFARFDTFRVENTVTAGQSFRLEWDYEVVDGIFVCSTLYDIISIASNFGLKNCHFDAGNNEATIGIEATNGGSFHVSGCTFRGFGTALASQMAQYGRIAVCNSTFEDCKLAVGLLFTEMSFHGTTFVGYSEAAIRRNGSNSGLGLLDLSVKYCSFTPAESFTGVAIQLFFGNTQVRDREVVSSCFNGATLPQIELNNVQLVVREISFAAPQPTEGSGVLLGGSAWTSSEFAYGVTGCSISSEDAECPVDFFTGLATAPPEATIPTPIRPLPDEPPPATPSPANTSVPPTATQEFTESSTLPRRGYLIYRMVAFAFSLD